MLIRDCKALQKILSKVFGSWFDDGGPFSGPMFLGGITVLRDASVLDKC